MIEVEIRHLEDGYGVPIGEYEVSDIQPLINLFKTGAMVDNSETGDTDLGPSEYDSASYYAHNFRNDVDGFRLEIIVK